MLHHRVTILLLLLTAHGYSQGDAEQKLANLKALAESKNKITSINALNELAEWHYNLDIRKSLDYGQEALDLALEEDYKQGIQNAYKILRKIHRRLGNYNVAIEYTLKNLPIAEQLRDTAELLDAYTTLGNIHSAMGNFAESQQYLKQARVIGEKINAPTLANILNYIGRGYGKSGQYDSAVYYIKAAMQRELDYPQPGYGLSYIYNNLAEVYVELGKYDEAIHFYDLSASLEEERKSPLGKTFTLSGLARVYQRKKEYDKAIAFALQSIELATQNLYRDKAREAYGILYEIYQDKGDFEKALQYYKQFNIYKDSIFSEDRMQYIENLKINYETERIQQENELLKKDTELKDAQLKEQYLYAVAFGVILLFVFTASFLMYLNNRQRRRTNTLLHQYNQDLELQVQKRTKELLSANTELVKQNAQLEQFGYITAHNLRAPVARILGLGNIAGNTDHFSLPRDQDILKKLQASAHELDTIIHDLNAILDVKKGIHHAYESINLVDQFEKVKSILKDKISESHATINESFEAKTCYAVPAYMESIFYNLLSNAIKYRHSDRKPVIKVKTHIMGNDLHITVSDNGIGLDLDKLKSKMFSLYQRFHHHVEGKGLGLFLVKTQVEALNGSIDVQSTVGEGSTFDIRIPIK
ncbi:MAG TPA: tetratricopeptide repeat-containing sensor histidine kinase [Cyclobacteriaceae bacterium]|nr:tetratricopeptide repeat-containing sensor histidine kinase [Cyclobacteriaceae bacterium]HRJ81142.1 tetratricopeptide repeat-containing sensor histidine kinase [Cyclobacteriaceae bacterium]